MMQYQLVERWYHSKHSAQKESLMRMLIDVHRAAVSLGKSIHWGVGYELNIAYLES
jgi:hypothetical protein